MKLLITIIFLFSIAESGKYINILISNYYFILTIEFPLIFTPSPNISAGQEAVFNCFNEVYLEPTWYINGESLLYPSNADRSDITVIDEGTSNTTLIIDGLIENDGTTVQCIASGLVDGTLQQTSSVVHTLYILGMQ